jgi:ABC-type nitrate/sulfonate/bicarbonate transport system substrate-binding protein
VDIGFYTADWVIRSQNAGGADVKLFLGGSNIPVYSLIVGKGIESYDDIRGERVAVSALKSTDAYILDKMLQANGLSKDDYSVIQAGGSTDRAAAIQAGSVAASLVIPPYDQVLVDAGYERLDVSSNTLTDYLWETNFASGAWLETNKKTAQSYCNAWLKAVDWIYDPANRDEAIDILERELKVSEGHASKAFDLYADGKVWAQGGHIEQAGIDAMMESLIDRGELTEPTPPESDFVDAATCGI